MTATEVKMSLLKWISVFQTLSHLFQFTENVYKCRQNLTKVDFLGRKLRKRKKISSSLVISLIKREIRHFPSQSYSNGKEMYKKAWCTCKLVVLFNNPCCFDILVAITVVDAKTPYWLSGKTMGFHDGAWFHCTAHHTNFSHLAYYTRQIPNRTIFNTLINHNFCNSLSHQKCPLEREADQQCKQHKESVF